MSRAAGAARFRFGPAALACCAGKRLRVSSAPHPCGFESHEMGPYKNGPLSRTVSNSVVGDEGCPRAAGAARSRFGPVALACCAGKRLRVSSAPHPCGFESHEMGPYKNGPLSRTVSNSVVGDEGCPRAAGAARSRFGPVALACCAGKRLRVSSAPHPCGFESHALGPKKKGLHRWRPNKSMVGDEGFEPPALCV